MLRGRNGAADNARTSVPASSAAPFRPRFLGRDV